MNASILFTGAVEEDPRQLSESGESTADTIQLNPSDDEVRKVPRFSLPRSQPAQNLGRVSPQPSGSQSSSMQSTLEPTPGHSQLSNACVSCIERRVTDVDPQPRYTSVNEQVRLKFFILFCPKVMKF